MAAIRTIKRHIFGSAIAADVCAYAAVASMSPGLAVRFPALPEFSGFLAGILLMAGGLLWLFALGSTIYSKSGLGLAAVAVSGILTWNFMGSAFHSHDQYWVDRFQNQNQSFQKGRDWLEQTYNSKTLEETRVADAPIEVANLAIADDAITSSSALGERFLVLPVFIYGIDNATAYVCSLSGEPPPKDLYFEIVSWRRLDKNWFLVKTT